MQNDFKVAAVLALPGVATMLGRGFLPGTLYCCCALSTSKQLSHPAFGQSLTASHPLPLPPLPGYQAGLHPLNLPPPESLWSDDEDDGGAGALESPSAATRQGLLRGRRDQQLDGRPAATAAPLLATTTATAASGTASPAAKWDGSAARLAAVRPTTVVRLDAASGGSGSDSGSATPGLSRASSSGGVSGLSRAATSASGMTTATTSGVWDTSSRAASSSRLGFVDLGSDNDSDDDSAASDAEDCGLSDWFARRRAQSSGNLSGQGGEA